MKAASPDSRYVEAAASILSQPLPEDVCIPAEAQSLFVQLFDRAAEEPSLTNIRKVYQLLKGTSAILLRLLSSASLLRLEQHLFVIIGKIKGENQSLSLYCLAIMRAMSSSADEGVRFSNSQYDTQELLASTQLTSASKWTPDAILQFFSGSKAHKTVQLVVLRAMWSCTASTGEPYDERMETLVLANEVICAIPPHLRETWRKTNSLIVGKLQDKVVAALLEPGLKFQGLCFLAQVTEGSRIPATVIDGLRGLVMRVDTLCRALLGVPQAQLDHLMDAGVLDENTTMTLLQQAVDFIAGASYEQSLEKMNCLRTIFRHVYAALATDLKLSEGAMLAIDVISCGQKLRQLLDPGSLSLNPGDSDSTRACAHAIQKARSATVHILCQIFLKAALCSPHQSYSISQNTISLLLDLHARSASFTLACSHSVRPRNPNSPSLRLDEASHHSSDRLPNWREAIRRHAENRAFNDADTLTAVFAKACADLEARCEGVETPFKVEREKLEALRCQHTALEQSYSGLKAEAADRSVRFNAMEMERDQYMSDLEAQREEIEGHERRVEELLQALQQAREEAEQSALDARHHAENAQMEHAAAFARKDEELEELQRALDLAQREGEQKSADILTSREKTKKLQQSLQHTSTELEQANRLIKQHQSESATLKQQADSLDTWNTELSAALDATRNDAMAQREAFERDLNDTKQQTEQDLTAANKEHKARIAHLTREFEENAQSLRKQLADVQEEVCQAREQHRADIEQWDADIGDKQKKV